jgi:hypothetical protein
VGSILLPRIHNPTILITILTSPSPSTRTVSIISSNSSKIDVIDHLWKNLTMNKAQDRGHAQVPQQQSLDDWKTSRPVDMSC